MHNRKARMDMKRTAWGWAVSSGVPSGGGEVFGMFKTPPPEIPKALQNRAILNPIVKTVKNCWI